MSSYLLSEVYTYTLLLHEGAQDVSFDFFSVDHLVMNAL
jgi:hypothetical protein